MALKIAKQGIDQSQFYQLCQKICESVIHERLLSHCIRNNVITDRQAAYLKGDSTISQLLYLVHQIRLSCYLIV